LKNKHYVFLFALLLFSFVKAQESQPVLDPEQEKYQNSLDKYYKQRSVLRPQSLQILEKELEESEYFVGPGDKFKVSLIGDLQSEFEFEILPEGVVIIPTVGEIPVNGLTLKSAKQLILHEIEKYYIKSKISINLIGLRRFRVYLTGHVNNPGTYFVQGTDRISDVIEAAQGITDWADETRIQIIHNDGTSTQIDLSRFYIYGEKESNPFLNGGDVITITSIDLTGGYVIVEGNAEIVGTLQEREIATSRGTSNLLGVFPLKKNESLYEFLKRIRALNRNDAQLRMTAILPAGATLQQRVKTNRRKRPLRLPIPATRTLPQEFLAGKAAFFALISRNLRSQSA